MMQHTSQTNLKILMVSEDIPAQTLGGLGKHVVRLGNHLIQHGHTVDLMGRADIDYELCRGEVGFEGKFIPGFDFMGTNWKEGKSGVFMPGKRSYAAHRIARAILRVADQYDVIHYHGHYPMIGCHVPAHINFVQTRHDQGSDCPTHVRFKHGEVCSSNQARDCARCAPGAQPDWLREQVSGFAVRQYRQQTARSFARHKTIFVSEFLRRAYLSHVPQTNPRKLHVIHNFIDIQSLPQPQANDTPHVLFVGRIDESKGVMALLDELAKLDAYSLSLDLIGDGPHRTACEARHSASHVRFHGWKSQTEALDATARAGCIVVPSVWEEPCGTTILEGLALCKPVYALARGGTPELKCYEKWPGQLQLFDDMAGLAKALAENAGTAPPPIQFGEFGADIRPLAANILNVYVR